MKDFKIIRGKYLTAVGQETGTYYFKICSAHPDYDNIEAGSVFLSFYQTDEQITPLTVPIRADGIITEKKVVHSAFLAERRLGIPMMPVIEVIDFDIIQQKGIMSAFEMVREEIQLLRLNRKPIKSVRMTSNQIDLFEEIGGDTFEV